LDRSFPQSVSAAKVVPAPVVGEIQLDNSACGISSALFAKDDVLLSVPWGNVARDRKRPKQPEAVHFGEFADVARIPMAIVEDLSNIRGTVRINRVRLLGSGRNMAA
jgi:hypothetical protein